MDTLHKWGIQYTIWRFAWSYWSLKVCPMTCIKIVHMTNNEAQTRCRYGHTGKKSWGRRSHYYVLTGRLKVKAFVVVIISNIKVFHWTYLTMFDLGSTWS